MVEKLKSLINKWEGIALSSWSDHYSDAIYNCINDLQEIIKKEEENGTTRKEN